jgi:hypothetical protein
MIEPDYIKTLKQSMHLVFDTPQGKQVMEYLESISGWTPTVADSMETNDIIARDANRRVLGTIKTILKLSPDQLIELFNP